MLTAFVNLYSHLFGDLRHYFKFFYQSGLFSLEHLFTNHAGQREVVAQYVSVAVNLPVS